MGEAPEERRNWISRTINALLSHKEDAEPTGTPDEMIDEAARRAFKLSTALGLIPGPIGMATILPEVAALTRLQINLIKRIARHHHKEEQASAEIILLIRGNVLGVAAGETLVRRMGTALVMRSVNARVVKRIAGAVGTRIVNRAAERAAARWIPVVTAPLFGYMSRSLTRKIGREAERLFSLEMIVEPSGGAVG